MRFNPNYYWFDDTVILLMANQIMKHHFLLYITEAVLSWSFRDLRRFVSVAWLCKRRAWFRRSFCRGFRRRLPERPLRCRFGRGTSWTSLPAFFSLPLNRLSKWGGKYVLLLGLRSPWRFWGFWGSWGLFFGLGRGNDFARFYFFGLLDLDFLLARLLVFGRRSSGLGCFGWH